MKPMLAKNLRDHRHKISYPFFLQPKLNGVRALYYNRNFQSRDEIFWNPQVLAHLHPILDTLPRHYIYDGEFYVHGWSLQQINSAVSVNRSEPSPKTPLVEYHLFDLIDPRNPLLKFSERSQILARSVPSEGPVKLVPTHYISEKFEEDYWYAFYKGQEYEGAMYRTDSPYGLLQNCGNKENRWDCLLKRKEFLDWEGYVTGIVESPVNPGTVGSLCFMFDNGRPFTAGSGLTHEQKRRFFVESPIGLRVRIHYLMLSDNGTPLNPYVECVYESH